MGQLRIRHGLAYGRENNFYTANVAGGTGGLIAQANTAPDVTAGVLFYTNNTGSTIIRDFTLRHPAEGQGNLAGLFEGKIIRVVFLDSNTRYAFSASGPLIGGTDGLQGASNFADFFYHTSAWYLGNFNRPTNPMIVYTSSNVVYGTQSSLSVQGKNTVTLLNAANSSLTFFTLTGGEQNQEVTLYAVNSALQFTANTSGLQNSLVVTSTGGSTVVLSSGQTMSFRLIGSQWIESR